MLFIFWINPKVTGQVCFNISADQECPDFLGGPSGFVDKGLLEKHLASPALGDKLKIFLCGEHLSLGGSSIG